MASPLLIICVIAVSIILAVSLALEFYCENQALKKSSKLTSKKKPHCSHSTSGETPAAHTTLVFPSQQEYQSYIAKLELVTSFLTRVVGVSYDNDDGTSRQEILSECFEGEDVELKHQWYNGKPAFAVVSDHGQIGYLSQDEATDFYNRYYLNDDADAYLNHASISSITGGTDDYKYGCWIRVEVYRT